VNQGICAFVTNLTCNVFSDIASQHSGKSANTNLERNLTTCGSCDCTIFRHPPVDELHSIENKGDKTMQNPIDEKFAGCKTQSFFDSF